MRGSRFNSYAGAVAALLLALAAAPSTRAASINYGNSAVLPPGMQFQAVTESSATDPVPLYGAPTFSSVAMDFNPASFGAFGSGGGTDITDGQLNFTLVGTFTGTQIVTIDQISLSESGDYTLSGTGTTATQVIAGASLHVKVTEIDGVPTSVTLPSSIASVGFNLVANPGVLQPWSLGTTVDVDAALTALAVPFTHGATKVEVVIDNNLIALSEAGSAALILKKEFEVEIDPAVTLVPEPAALSLLTLGAAGLLMRRRNSTR
jgi:hypothetical protein